MLHRWWTDEAELVAGADRPAQPGNPPPTKFREALECWLKRGRLPLAAPLTGGDWRAWRETTRAEVLNHLAWPKSDAPLDVEVTERREHPDFVEEQIVFTGAAPLRVPATVVVPKRASSKPLPAIIVLHDMGGLRLFGRDKMLAFAGESKTLTDFRQQLYGGRSLLAELARCGYVAICIDAFNFGQRTTVAIERPEEFERLRRRATPEEARAYSLNVAIEEEPLMVRNVMAVGRTWAGLTVEDDQRTVDYLLSRTDVDPNRIGCIGLSFGAYRANYLAALDERVKASVTACWTSTVDAVIGFNQYALNWFSLVPGLFALLDIPDLLALAAPRALMVMSGWRDGLMRPSGITRAHLQLRESFARFGCADQLGSLVYDAPHELNLQMQRDVFDWLDEKLSNPRGSDHR